MFGTLLSVFFAAYFWWHPIEDINTPFLRVLMAAIGVLFLFHIPLTYLFILSPLQNAERFSSPRIIDMFRKDKLLKLSTTLLLIFSFASLFFSIETPFLSPIIKFWGFFIWIILLGMAADSLLGMTHHAIKYLNPFMAVELFSRQAKRSVQDDRELDLCHWIDGLSEITLKSIKNHSPSLSNESLSEMQGIARLFFESSKSIGHLNSDKQTEEMGITDKVSYTMFYLYQRLDVIFEQALKNKLEMTCSYIMTLLGKITIDAAKYDVSMASAPLHFMGKFAKKAQQEGFEETALTASCTFIEVAKAILTEIDISYYEIKDPFLSIINGLEILAKGAFRNDKTIPIALLLQPFQELKRMFETEKTKNHQDTPVIMQNIDRVISEFQALQMVMNTIPPIPSLPET